MKFGDYVKNKRIDQRLTMREFCRQIGIDASNWSKVERGIIPPSKDPESLKAIFELLGLSETEKVELNDLADLARGQIPADLQDVDLMAKMPAFFRAIREKEYNQDDLEQIIKGVRKSNSSDSN